MSFIAKALILPEPAVWSSDRYQAGMGKVGSPLLSSSDWASWTHREALISGKLDTASDQSVLRNPGEEEEEEKGSGWDNRENVYVAFHRKSQLQEQQQKLKTSQIQTRTN